LLTAANSEAISKQYRGTIIDARRSPLRPACWIGSCDMSRKPGSVVNLGKCHLNGRQGIDTVCQSPNVIGK
jgi:hypothetical protein